MKLTRRKVRRVSKWTGLITVLLLLGMDVASAWWVVAFRTADYLVVIDGGCAGIWNYEFPSTGARFLEQFNTHPFRYGWNLWGTPQFVEGPPVIWCAVFPVCVITGIFALPTACLWWLDRRDKDPVHCQKCGYDLAGLAKGTTCPECGKPRPRPAT